VSANSSIHSRQLNIELLSALSSRVCIMTRCIIRPWRHLAYCRRSVADRSHNYISLVRYPLRDCSWVNVLVGILPKSVC